MKPDPLSARLLAQADDLRRLAHLCCLYNPQLANALVLQAARMGLHSVAAKNLEQDLRAARNTARELGAEMAEEAEATTRAVAAMERRHARQQIIADMIAPVLRGPAA